MKVILRKLKRFKSPANAELFVSTCLQIGIGILVSTGMLEQEVKMARIFKINR